MGGTNPMAPYTKLDNTSMLGTTYKTTIDGNSVAAQRIVGKFVPHAQITPNMTVIIDAGHIFDGETLTELAAQTTSAFSAPIGHPRIDRIVVDNTSGAISVVPGTEATSPVAPAIPAGKSPVAQVAFTTSTTAITNAQITDERDFSAANAGGFGQQDSISSSATTDLGTITSHNALINGTSTISSFGSTASVLQPIYLIEFSGALTLTNSTSLVCGANITTAAGDCALAEYLGSGNWRVREYSRASSLILTTGFIKRTTFFSSGTFTPQPGTTIAYVRGRAGGGAGGGAPTTSSGYGSGAGGGEGGLFEGWLTIAAIGSSQAVTIGAGGTGATQTSNTQAATGGTTSFGSIMSATGGLGGYAYSTSTVGIPSPGGGGGTASGGDINLGGACGTPGANGIFGGAGGGSGGGSPTGIGSSVVGNAGSNGGGGGGANNGNSQASKAGGTGGEGWLVVDEYSS